MSHVANGSRFCIALCLGLPKKKLWDPIVERLDKRLSSWKGRYLSMGGCLTHIKSVLSSTPIYFLFLVRMPGKCDSKAREVSA